MEARLEADINKLVPLVKNKGFILLKDLRGFLYMIQSSYKNPNRFLQQLEKIQAEDKSALFDKGILIVMFGREVSTPPFRLVPALVDADLVFSEVRRRENELRKEYRKIGFDFTIYSGVLRPRAFYFFCPNDLAEFLLSKL